MRRFCDSRTMTSNWRISSLCLAVPMLLASGGKPQHAAPAGPVVHIAGGMLRGTQRDGVAVFEGVPFAAPPVGPLRWREPQAAAAWAGVREATAPSHPCIQNVAGTDSFLAPLAAAYGDRVYPTDSRPIRRLSLSECLDTEFAAACASSSHGVAARWKQQGGQRK